MSIKSLRSGTLRKLRNGKALVTAPEAPTISSVTNTEVTRPVISFTPSNTGVTATSFTVTSTPGSYTATGNSSPITYNSMGIASGSYNFSVTGTAATGTGLGSAASSLLSLDPSYTLFQTFTSSGTFTVPVGCTKLAVFALGGGSGGNSGANTSGNVTQEGNYIQHYNYNAAGSGGSSSAIAGFKDHAVSSGQTYSVTIGAGGNAASGGGTTSFGSLLSVAGNSVSGNGSGLTSTSASGGGAGGGGGTYTQRNFDGGVPSDNRGAGTINNTPISLTQNLTDIGATTTNGSNGGGGGGTSRTNSNLGAGYGGGDSGDPGGNATGYGMGGGGGGFRFYQNNNPTQPTSGGAGFQGVVYVYCGN